MDLKNEPNIEAIIGAPEGAHDRSTVALTVDQRDMVDRAIEKLREEIGESGLSEGRCLEIICFDFMQSFMVKVPTREDLVSEDDDAVCEE